MSEDWGERKKPGPEDGRCDSGIAESVQSLCGDGPPRLYALEEEEGHSPPPGDPEDKTPEGPELERVDSAYGSSSLIEPESAPPPAQRPPSPETPRLDPQQLENLTYVSEDGDTLLHLAVIHSMADIALYFISLVSAEILDIQNDLYQDRKGDTALHVACKNQHLECARIILRGPGGPQNLHLQNWKGLACLHVATLKSDHALISLLLESGADLNNQEGTSGKTPLHLAVEMLDSSLLTKLLRHRPSVNAAMYNGCTPLHLAVGRKDAGLARLLCQAGADTLLRNREGDTPHDLAEGNNQLLALLPFDDLKISGQPVVTSA
uniref:NF-kappa-B inhibitor epsilon n=1 Tax=Leptobrachium leishanense TaxID=445787 RepID=A0A8C5R1R9_9ANUR